MKRRTLRGESESSLPTSSRPLLRDWKTQSNTSLIEESQYKLKQQQRIHRVLQQLSTAHFSVRSPAVLASRHRLTAENARRSVSTKPRRVVRFSTDCTQLLDAEDTRDVHTVRRRRVADVLMDRKELTSRCKKTGFAAGLLQDKNDRNWRDKKAMSCCKQTQLQRVEELERMLDIFMTETKKFDQQQVPEMTNTEQTNKSVQKTQWMTKTNDQSCLQGEMLEENTYRPQKENEIIRSMNGSLKDENGGDVRADHETKIDDVNVGKRLEAVCYKTLKIGLELACNLETMKKEVEYEKKHRADRDLTIEMLEQEVRATQAKCKCLETKYENIVSQVNDMRTAVIATEEAMSQMTLAFESSKCERNKMTTLPASTNSGSS